jgi:hypothetical protein
MHEPLRPLRLVYVRTCKDSIIITITITTTTTTKKKKKKKKKKETRLKQAPLIFPQPPLTFPIRLDREQAGVETPLAIIGITGASSQEEIEKGRSSGMTMTITKPIGRVQLRQVSSA